MALQRTSPQNVFLDRGNSLAIYIDGKTNALMLKDSNGQIQPVSDYISGASGNFIQNQKTIAQDASFRIAGVGIIGELLGSFFPEQKLNVNGYFNLGDALENIYIGNSINQSITTGTRNISIGSAVLNSVVDGTDNIGIGSNTLQNNQQSENIAIGTEAAYGGTDGVSNIVIGVRAFRVSNGSNNVIMGGNSFLQHEIGSENICIGNNSNEDVLNSERNIILGHNATSNDFSNCLLIGNRATALANNQIVIGSTSIPLGTVTLENVVSDNTLEILLNGVKFKILLKKV